MKSTDVIVTVTSAVELTSAQEKALAQAVKKKRNVSSVTIEKVVDPSVIGGLTVTIDSVEFDGTVAGKLEKIKSQLMRQL